MQNKKVGIDANIYPYWLTYLKILNKPIGNLAQEMVAGIATIYRMVAIRIEELTEILISLHESFRILEGVLWMNIIVSHTMTDK